MLNNLKIPKYLSRILLNFSSRSLANLFSKSIGLVTFPLITRALGPEAFGHFSIISIIIQYTTLPIGMLGLQIYGIREISKKNFDANDITNSVISTQLSISIISILLSLGAVTIIFISDLDLYAAIIISYIIVITYSLNLEFFFVANKNLFLTSITRIAGQIIYVIGVVLFVKSKDDLIILSFFLSLTSLIDVLLQHIWYRKSQNQIKISFSLKKTLKLFKQTFKLGLSANLEGIYPTIPMLFISVLLNNYYLGIWAGGYKIFSIMLLFYITLYYSLAPYVVKIIGMDKKVKSKYILLIFSIVSMASFLGGLMMFLFGESILILLLGKQFKESILVFNLICLILIPLYPIFMFCGNLLIYSDNEKYYLFSLIISVSITLILTPIAIFYFELQGIVFAMGISILSAILFSGYFITNKILLSNPDVVISND